MSSVALLAVRPHPDDECTGTGGILAYYASRGIPVGVLTCTLGEEGEILDPDLDPEEARPRLGEIRERELRAACAVLGVSELRLLHYRDSGMQGTEANQRPDAFCNVPLDEAAGKVAAVIRELRPRVVITENERGGYGHPDHIMCHKVAVRGVELSADPAFRSDGLGPWQADRLFTAELVIENGERIANMLRAERLDMGWFEHFDEGLREMGIKPQEADACVDVGNYIGRMRDALAQHRTQIPPGHFLLTWPPPILREVFRTAYFRQVYPPRSGGSQSHDLLENFA
ncbi:MAG TPA: PIG-L family deacetylase [Chloroflexota bacterium]|nr:PIG-L family deacetylase [Chloroflexota bacterium]